MGVKRFMKALIVDDSLESRKLLAKILINSFGAQIVEAAHGKEALRKLSQERPDAVFLDYEMPVMDGKETLKAIRSIREYRNLPIVMVTSHSEIDLVRELISYKISAYLVKPLSTDYVIKRLSLVFPHTGSNH
jgi:CheY-like chemotaxis protein